MISAVSVISAGIVGVLSLSCCGQRKADLVAVGHWALATGDSSLVSAVTLAIAREGLTSA